MQYRFANYAFDPHVGLNFDGRAIRNSSVTTVLDGAGNQMLMPSRRS
jgi:hypothetical protein